MTEFKVSTSIEGRRQVLRRAVDRIKDRCRSNFKGKVAVGYCLDEAGSFFWIEEIRTMLLKRRELFRINKDRSWSHEHKRWEITCTVSDPSLLDIVKEELQEYTEMFDVAFVHIEQSFV